MLFILEMLLSYLIENKDKKIEASALNEMLEKYKEELEKEQEEDIIIKKRYLEILENINQLIVNQNNNEIIKKLKKLLEESIKSKELVSYAKNYNEAEHGNIKQLNAGLGTTKELI